MASAGARAYSGGLGAVPPVGSRGRRSGGRSPLKADNILVLLAYNFRVQGADVVVFQPNRNVCMTCTTLYIHI